MPSFSLVFISIIEQYINFSFFPFYDSILSFLFKPIHLIIVKMVATKCFLVDNWFKVAW